MDFFICSKCNVAYHDLDLFMLHKRSEKCIHLINKPVDKIISATQDNTVLSRVNDDVESIKDSVLIEITASNERKGMNRFVEYNINEAKRNISKKGIGVEKEKIVPKSELINDLNKTKKSHIKCDNNIFKEDCTVNDKCDIIPTSKVCERNFTSIKKDFVISTICDIEDTENIIEGIEETNEEIIENFEVEEENEEMDDVIPPSNGSQNLNDNSCVSQTLNKLDAGAAELLNQNEIHVCDNVNTSEGIGMPYASTPGLYTLLLNQDNTFTLVAGGYQGTSSNSEKSRVFVCQLCKKFAPTHVEVLNHITTTHPNYINSINDCVTELQSISQSTEKKSYHSSDSSSEEIMTVNISAQTSVAAKEKLDNDSENIDLHIICKEVKKKKVGRPRKEEKKCENTMGLPGEKLCVFENGKIVCINCKKTFMKQRQFDKHICVTEEILPDNSMENLVNPKMKLAKENVEVKDEFMESMDELMNLAADIADEDLRQDEEWKYNKEWKQSSRKHISGTKINSTRNGKRKRGRPPKVEAMALLAEELESNQEQETSLRVSYNSDNFANSEELANQCINELILSKGVKNSKDLKSIQTVPLFSNTKQQERLQKWVSQVDLSFADAIIDIVPASLDADKSPEPRFTKSRLEELGLMKYVCQECNRQFKTLLSCRRHCAKHLSVKAFTCPDCGYATGSVGSLYSHYRIHTGNLYACDICDFKARIKAHYRDHLETHNPSRHVCELCQRVYSTANSLSSHIYKSHRNQEGLNYCKSKRIQKTMKSKVNNHIEYFQRLSNAKRKIFIDKYLSKDNLEKTFIKTPMKCEVCGEDFEYTKKHLIKHRIVFICWCCSQSYATLNNLRQHLRKSSAEPEAFQEKYKLSLLCSFTSKDTFARLIDGRHSHIGPIIKELMKDIDNYSAPDQTLNENLFKQLSSWGYSCVYELITIMEEKQKDLENSSEIAQEDVMKIIIDTSIMEKKKKDSSKVSIEKENTSNPEFEYPVQTNSNTVSDVELRHSGIVNNAQVSSDSGGQQVFVINNCGGSQTTIHMEDGQIMMEDEKFLIINEGENTTRSLAF